MPNKSYLHSWLFKIIVHLLKKIKNKKCIQRLIVWIFVHVFRIQLQCISSSYNKKLKTWLIRTLTLKSSLNNHIVTWHDCLDFYFDYIYTLWRAILLENSSVFLGNDLDLGDFSFSNILSRYPSCIALLAFSTINQARIKMTPNKDKNNSCSKKTW